MGPRDPRTPCPSRRERLGAAIRREPVDRVPYAFWRRFPAVDRSPAGLAQATLRFHERYGSDVLIITPRPGYAVEAWGCLERDEPDPDGERPCLRCGVESADDWRHIRPVDPASGPGWAGVLETIVRLGFDRRLGDAPVVLTLPSPLSVARRLAGGRFAEDVRHRPDAVTGALEIITETVSRFADLALGEGLAGVFYGIRGPSARPDDDAYLRFGEPYDRRVLEALGARSSLTILHAEEAVPFEGLARLPGHVVAWDARRSLPRLGQGQARVSGAVLGGLAQTTLLDGTPAEAAQEALEAVAETHGRGLIVAPGGPLAPSTPDATVAAVVKALGGMLTPLYGVAGITR